MKDKCLLSQLTAAALGTWRRLAIAERAAFLTPSNRNPTVGVIADLEHAR